MVNDTNEEIDARIDAYLRPIEEAADDDVKELVRILALKCYTLEIGIETVQSMLADVLRQLASLQGSSPDRPKHTS